MGKEKAFDLASIDTIAACNKPVEIEIKHPVTGIGTNVFFSVLGRDSDTFRELVRGLADQTLKRQATGRGSADTSLEKIEQKNIDGLVAVTVGWRTGDEPSVTIGGEKLDFTPVNVRRAYAILPIREQVTEAINNLENFMPA